MSLSFRLVLFCTFLFYTFCNAQTLPARPRAVLIPVTKDASSLLYLTKINQRTPSVSVNLVLDLGGQILWIDCDPTYNSSTYIPIKCKTPQCTVARSITTFCDGCPSDNPPWWCYTNNCGLFALNPLKFAAGGGMAQDSVSLPSTNGANPGLLVTFPSFQFACAYNMLLEGLPNGVIGIAGLSRSKIGLPAQFASFFSFRNKKFAICLPSTPNSQGVVFFGDAPYKFLPNIDASQLLTYTPLLINPVSDGPVPPRGKPSDEYYIGIKSIKINKRLVSLNTSLLTIHSDGNGGTKISTMQPYTVLETSIFKAISNIFIEEALTQNIIRVGAVSPFEVCFGSKNIVITRGGPAVPIIDFVMQSESVVWTITGSNSMVQVNKSVHCLGFVDGGGSPKTSIVIGGHQLEDKVLEFDLKKSRLGFSPTLLGSRTTCANFNFTSIP